ncbi:hypothetical protein U9M48_041306 [Paspalum notatum var. saurae]|uniref:UBC core domain-containing protein n=1 Tax=Paspalum notatum var. saurae TaxID=547442 RepID=A0AAQ3UQ92_PASNO
MVDSCSVQVKNKFTPRGLALHLPYAGAQVFAGDSNPQGIFSLPSFLPWEADAQTLLQSIKGQKKDDAANTNGKPAAKKLSAGELRLHKDIAELNLPKTTKITFPNDKDDLMNFETTIKLDEGYYVVVKPHGSMVYHPNIDLEGNVCLNILREDRKPVLNINTIVYGLNLLFSNFERNVRRAMAGGYVGETHFPRIAQASFF